MRRRVSILPVSSTAIIQHRPDILTAALSSGRSSATTDHSNSAFDFTTSSITDVGVASVPLQVELKSVAGRSNVADQTRFRMEVSDAFERSTKAAGGSQGASVASDNSLSGDDRPVLPARTNKGVYFSVLNTTVPVLICLICLLSNVGFSEAVPINYPRNRAPDYPRRQTNVLMPPLDLGFRPNPNGNNPQSHYNPYWQQERADPYSDTADIAPGPPMSLTSGYNKNRPPNPLSPADNNFRRPYNQMPKQVYPNYGPIYQEGRRDIDRRLQPVQQPNGPNQPYDIMQNDPVYTEDQNSNPIGRMPPQQPQYYNKYDNRPNTFHNQYAQLQPQLPYGQPNGYYDTRYNIPAAPTYREEPDASAYPPNTEWNNGYLYQPNWYPPWQAPPRYAPPSRTGQQAPKLGPPYGSVYGHPSNYAEISEEELARRRSAYEENVQKAGAHQGRQLTDGLQLPPLEADLDPVAGMTGRGKDKGITLSGSDDHDTVVRKFNQLAATYPGPNSVAVLFNDIDLDRNGMITEEELRKFLQLHEVYPHA